jgi:hypothetical protein
VVAPTNGHLSEEDVAWAEQVMREHGGDVSPVEVPLGNRIDVLGAS